MTKKLIKVGIVGFGYMGHFHLNKANEMEGFEVVAAFDSNPDKLMDAQKAGLKACSTMKELLAIEDIDLIIIATPNQMHAKYAIEALNAKKHVLCEKPATMNCEEAKQVVECANKNERIFTVHQNRRWDLDYMVVQKVKEEKEIGSFTTIESRTYGQRGVCFGWRADPEAGGGMLYDWGVHLIDQILQLFPTNKVVSVYGRLLSVLTPVVDDYFEVKLRLDNEVCANVSVGTFALQDLPRWFVFGDRGTLKLDDFTGNRGGAARIKGTVKGFESVIGHKNLGPSRTMAHLEPENFEKLNLPIVEDKSMEFYRNLLGAIRGEEELYVTQEDILRLMSVVDAVFLSAAQEDIIKVSI